MAGRKKTYRGKHGKAYRSGYRRPSGSGRGRRRSPTRRLKQTAGKVAFSLWVVATAACIGYGIANDDWMPTFWCGYVVYADLIFSL